MSSLPPDTSYHKEVGISIAAAPSPRAASDNASYACTSAESGLSAEVVYNTIVGSLGSFGAVTISSGSVAKPADEFCLSIGTEGGADSDDLDTITGGGEGDLLITKAEDSGRTVVCKDGTGNLKLAGDPLLGQRPFLRNGFQFQLR